MELLFIEYLLCAGHSARPLSLLSLSARSSLVRSESPVRNDQSGRGDAGVISLWTPHGSFSWLCDEEDQPVMSHSPFPSCCLLSRPPPLLFPFLFSLLSPPFFPPFSHPFSSLPPLCVSVWMQEAGSSRLTPISIPQAQPATRNRLAAPGLIN